MLFVIYILDPKLRHRQDVRLPIWKTQSAELQSYSSNSRSGEHVDPENPQGHSCVNLRKDQDIVTARK